MTSKLKRGDKAFMLTKSAGAKMDIVKKRIERNPGVYDTETIVYNGHTIKNAIIAYYLREQGNHFVFSYNTRLTGGDYYRSLDFVTEKDLFSQNALLPDDLFDL